LTVGVGEVALVLGKARRVKALPRSGSLDRDWNGLNKESSRRSKAVAAIGRVVLEMQVALFEEQSVEQA